MHHTIEKLRESQNWITKALEMVKNDTLESYLDYFQVGYVSGNWHLPTIVVSSNHEIHLRLAQLMNSKLRVSGFYINEEEAAHNGSLILFYKEERVGSINLFKREIYGSKDFQFEIEKKEHKVSVLGLDLKKLEETKRKSVEWLSQIKKSNRVKGLFFQKEEREHRDILASIDGKIEIEKVRINKLEKMYLSDIQRYKELLAALPFLSIFSKDHGILMAGHLNYDNKRYSFYHLIEQDKAHIDRFLSKNNSGGIYLVDPFVAFSKHFLNRFPVEDIRQELMVKAYEVLQENFSLLLMEAQQLEIEIEAITFSNGLQTESKQMKNNLRNAIQFRKTEELLSLAKEFRERGHDIENIHFTYEGVRVTFNRFGEISIQGQHIENEYILNSKPVHMLLGIV